MRKAKVLGVCCLAVTVVLHPEIGLADPLKPEPVKRDPSWLKLCFQQKAIAEKAKDAVFFVGDSITQFWTTTGKANWNLDFQTPKPTNLGIAADRVEHVHYRMRGTRFSKRHPPRLFVLHVGTNNLAKDPPDSPERVAKGIAVLSLTLRRKVPTCGVMVISILPSGYDPDSDLRKRIEKANDELLKLASKGEYTLFRINNSFLDREKKWLPGLTIDGTHLSRKGYDVFARTIAKSVERMTPPAQRGN